MPREARGFIWSQDHLVVQADELWAMSSAFKGEAAPPAALALLVTFHRFDLYHPFQLCLFPSFS